MLSVMTLSSHSLPVFSASPQTLDYETTTSYSLLMRATDRAPPFNENTANITISILDTNDNAPQFSMLGGVFLSVLLPRCYCSFGVYTCMCMQ